MPSRNHAGGGKVGGAAGSAKVAPRSNSSEPMSLSIEGRRTARLTSSRPGTSPGCRGPRPAVDPRRRGSRRSASSRGSLGLADVGDEDPLVSGPPVRERRVVRPAEGAIERGDQLPEAQRVGRAAADVEDLAPDRVDPLEGPLVGVDQVADPERVADLLAVAEDRERLVERRGDAEPGDPALVLDAELPRPVDAGLPERDGLQPVDPGVIADILVAGPLRAAVGLWKSSGSDSSTP